LVLGILYLTFQAFPIIFEEKHGFNLQSTGLTFLGIAVGMLIGLSTMPYWNRCASHVLRAITPLSSPPPPSTLQKRTDASSPILSKGGTERTKRFTAATRQQGFVW